MILAECGCLLTDARVIVQPCSNHFLAMQDHRARSPQPKAAQVTALIGQIGKLIDQDPCDQCHEVKPTLQYDIDSDHVFCSMECRNTWRKVHDVG